MSQSEARRDRPISNKILAGSDELIFQFLPERVLANLRRPTSENAWLWNLIYPLAQPTIELNALLAIRPLWGTTNLEEIATEGLAPFFWGLNIQGERLPGLDETLSAVDGPGLQTEVDLFLYGENNLILVETKHMSGLGRCSRYSRGVCPEIHQHSDETVDPCRYWESGQQEFSQYLDFGDRPGMDNLTPPCDRHYQLGRTLLVGRALAERLNRRLHVWMFVPSAQWKKIESHWVDFADRVRDHDLWRRMRVLAWEDLQALRKLTR
jgi:hypothetical protein